MLPAVTCALMGLAMPIPPSGDPPAGGPRAGPLEAARKIATWLDATSVETEHGIAWPADPAAPTPEPDRGLYHGSCGVILFMVELHRVTGDERALELATRGGDDLLGWRADAGEDVECGLWTGLAGQGLTLLALHEATGAPRFRIGAERCVQQLATRARPVGAGVAWNDVTDVIGGSAGIGLFLLEAATRLQNDLALRLAEAAGRGLLDAAIEVPPVDAGREPALKWAMTPTFARQMPNFSHGTAGVCFFLASLSSALEPDPSRRELAASLRDAAIAGGRYLRSIADTADGGCRVFHHEPGGETLYYLGWCHGPVGTAQLFDRLATLTGDASWSDWSRRATLSVRRSGIPERRNEGFWNNVGTCCGSAGVASFFLERYRRAGDADDLAFARRLIDDVLARGSVVETPAGPGLRWVQAEHRVRPDLLIAQTGYMQGAAGIGLTLLELHATQRGKPWRTPVPGGP